MKRNLLLLMVMPSVLGAMKRPLEKKEIAQKIARCQISEHEKFVRLFYKLGPLAAKIENKDRFLLLRKLVTSPHYVPLLKDLIEKKFVDPNSHFTQETRIYRLLNEAVYAEASENVQALLLAGADANLAAHNYEVEGSPEELPLFTAVERLDNWMLSILLHGKKANPNKQSSDFLPLTRAIQLYAGDTYPGIKNKSLIGIAVLLCNGANPDEVEKMPNGSLICISGTQILLTPRSLAMHRKYTEILKLFDQADEELQLITT